MDGPGRVYGQARADCQCLWVLKRPPLAYYMYTPMKIARDGAHFMSSNRISDTFVPPDCATPVAYTGVARTNGHLAGRTRNPSSDY
jgi:hypothetical protein